ncbi:hypothetical protein [Lutispora thermophila]|uniref:ATPase n=1 Tax=Lutispora thermophila DSM 19022 TaxID=1122184 RepID=A0A1M6EWW6_9FIRM|nr:hypothetical protein [Lutispora thermophila]SHI89974.1 hypothetical protein SAMN02745176_01749 [Lutispora thermophila DSM 19022]
MQEYGHVREFFLGANTHKGFHSFYDYVVPGIPNRLFILKGGPGTGKSTFLRKIASEFADMGYDVELHHCSSDNDSLDGIRIVPFNIAVMDGTAPHTTDPKYPAVVDEIINLGDYWHKEKIEKNRTSIISIGKELKKLYTSSYRFLNAAKEVQDDMEALIGDDFDWLNYTKMLNEYKMSIMESAKPTGKQGEARHLFHSSINSSGRVDYIEIALPKKHECHYIKCQYQGAATKLLNSIVSDLLMTGYDVEVFHQPLDPEIIETIMVNELGLVISSDANVEKTAVRVIDLDILRKKDISDNESSFLTRDRILFNNLIDEAIMKIRTAKKLHDELEKYYIESMDFKKIAELRCKVIERIRSMCK